MLSEVTVYVFDNNDKHKKIKVKINKKKILNEINKRLLLLIKNEAVSI
jgi:hypothetical protein